MPLSIPAIIPEGFQHSIQLPVIIVHIAFTTRHGPKHFMYILAQSTLINSMRYYYSHFMDEETESREGYLDLTSVTQLLSGEENKGISLQSLGF